jgi:L-2,4-diaminobutyrate decarboxylase
MDSFDQAPAATIVEQHMVRWLAELCGLPTAASGTFTAGGTQSNYLGLLLARDRFIEKRWRWCVRENGLPPEHSRLRILCSELAHFSVEKSALQLGLGTKSVVKVPVDETYGMCPAALRNVLHDLVKEGLEPFALFATAGTTDFASIDPLPPMAALAKEYGLWMHVDAAYGGALLLSESRRSALDGIARADSITIDFHKAFFQPISCSAFLLADSADFRFIRVHADYLNPESREDAGIPDLVTNSLLTTRRFDALKLWLSVQALGLREYGRMIDRLAELASFVAQTLHSRSCFRVLHEPVFGAVVFRYVPACQPLCANEINAAIPTRLFATGEAVLGHTVVAGQAHLKFTICNPCAAPTQLAAVIERIEDLGRQLEADMPVPAHVGIR